MSAQVASEQAVEQRLPQEGHGRRSVGLTALSIMLIPKSQAKRSRLRGRGVVSRRSQLETVTSGAPRRSAATRCNYPRSCHNWRIVVWASPGATVVPQLAPGRIPACHQEGAQR